MSADVERAGFVVKSGRLIELENKAENPSRDFLADPADVLAHMRKDIVALWHTHPHTSANLSSEDWQSFIGWPELEHIIISPDEIRFYGVKGAGVINLPLPEGVT